MPLRTIFLAFFACLLSTIFAQNPVELKDIGQYVAPSFVGQNATHLLFHTPPQQGFDDGSLWATDGTTAGTVKLTDLDAFYWWPEMRIPNRSERFWGHKPSNGPVELWKTEGTVATTSMVREMANYPYMSDHYEWNGKSYFTLYNFGTSDFGEVWVTDGTAAGTQWVSTGWEPFPSRFHEIPGTNGLFFLTGDGTGRQELWKTLGASSNTVRIKDFGMYKRVWQQAHVGNLGLYSLPWQQNPDSMDLWASDGTQQGTVRLHRGLKVIRIDSIPGQSRALLFVENASGLMELWESDGTVAGTGFLTVVGQHDIYPITHVDGGLLYFSILKGEVYTTNGTGPGTKLLVTRDRGPYGFTHIPGQQELYFQLSSTNADLELWKTDGSQNGTVMVRDMGHTSSWATTFVHDSLVFFCFVDIQAPKPNQVWRTDGTTAGSTFLMAFEKMLDGALHAIPGRAEAYIVAADSLTYGLYQTDGTAAGTVLQRDFNTEGWVDPPVTLLDRVYYSLGHGFTGAWEEHFWVADQYHLAADSISMVNRSTQSLTVHDGMEDIFFFTVKDDASWQLWRMNAEELVGAGEVVQDDFQLLLYPNPGNAMLSLRVLEGGKVGNALRVRVFDGFGREMKHANAKTGQLQISTTAWPAGMYVLRVEIGGKSVTRKWIKR